MTLLRFHIAGALLLLTLPSPAQEPPIQNLELEDVDLSYIYPVVMGTGSYQIDGRRLWMITAPFNLTQRQTGEGDAGIGVKWFLPVTLGYDEVEDYDWLGQLGDANLVTLSAMPGLQVSIPLSDSWTVRPFAQVGLGRDFVANEDFALGTLGVRLRGLWEFEQSWELRFGASVRVAGETQFKSGRQNSFRLFELGFDLRRDTRFEIDGVNLNAGAYYRVQSYYPEWTVGQIITDRSELNEVHEFGVSIGLTQPRKVFGLTVERLRVGYQRGSGLKGWTFGTEFPF